MKKVILSVVAISALAITGTYADTSSDIQEMKLMMKQMNQRLAKLEKENQTLKSQLKSTKKSKKRKKNKSSTLHAKSSKPVKKVHTVSTVPQEQTDFEKKFAKATVVKSKAPILKFSGLHYLGFVGNSADYMDGSTSSSTYFETRRNYLQVKAYFDEDTKSYMRVTLDTHQVHNSVDDDSDINFGNTGDWEVRLKYAYLYLDNILPYTGVEFGQAHRPWIDYEEHHGWNYRSISKVLVEAHEGAHFTTSADLGVDFKTKTPYFSSEIGIFNGEGYHGDASDNEHISGEWRLTGHLLGTGEKHVHKHDTYADVSFFGQYNAEYKEGEDDFIWYGAHAVYNQPEFLLAAQYVKATDGGVSKEGDGWSVNGEFRLNTFTESLHGWNVLARYDSFDLDAGEERERTIAGLAYQYNRYVEFIANYLNEQVDSKDVTDAFMLTAEVNW